MLLIYNTLFVKQPKDLLQGISKLDSIMKVSCFQKFKNPMLEQRKWAFLSILSSRKDSEYNERMNEESLMYAE